MLPQAAAGRRSKRDPESARQGSNADAGDCRTKLENAHRIVFRLLVYPWHPWFGMQVAIHEVVDKADGAVYRCTLSGSRSDRGASEVSSVDVRPIVLPGSSSSDRGAVCQRGCERLKHCPLFSVWHQRRHSHRQNFCFLAHATSLATAGTRESAMPQRTATRRSEGWRGSHPTHRQWDLFGVNSARQRVVSAPAQVAGVAGRSPELL